jgi:hypothetical protein
MRRRIGMTLAMGGVPMIEPCRVDLAHNNGCEYDTGHQHGENLAGFT